VLAPVLRICYPLEVLERQVEVAVRSLPKRDRAFEGLICRVEIAMFVNNLSNPKKNSAIAKVLVLGGHESFDCFLPFTGALSIERLLNQFFRRNPGISIRALLQLRRVS